MTTTRAEATLQDLEQLRILAIFHYVIAGLAALFACFPIIHLAIGLSILFGAGPWSSMPDNGPPIALFGLMFTVIPAVFIALGWATAFFIARAGSRLRQHRSHTFCLVMAAVACCFFPFGTALGVFTILVLSRPGVRRLFADNDGLAEVF
ncbi:MAG: hypothetical protein ACI8RZ_002871 [Myxococcota bacterium]